MLHFFFFIRRPHSFFRFIFRFFFKHFSCSLNPVPVRRQMCGCNEKWSATRCVSKDLSGSTASGIRASERTLWQIHKHYSYLKKDNFRRNCKSECMVHVCIKTPDPQIHTFFCSLYLVPLHDVGDHYPAHPLSFVVQNKYCFLAISSKPWSTINLLKPITNISRCFFSVTLSLNLSWQYQVFQVLLPHYAPQKFRQIL